MNLSPKVIRARLAQQADLPVEGHYPPGFFDRPPRPAAVLLPLFLQEGELHLTVLRRASIPGDLHSGQVAFPGGGASPEDTSPIVTAQRESLEELGIQPQDVTILGQLHQFLTVSNYVVTPVVGLIPWPYEFTLSPLEVERVFSIPLRWLADSENRYTLDRKWDDRVQFEVIYFKEYDNEVLWGASARFVCAFLQAIMPPGK